MKRWLALAVVGLMLAVPAASAASWERSGYDPGRTGAIPFEGPETNDTAFQIELPGVVSGPTILMDDVAYVATLDVERWGFDGDTDGLDTEAIWRIGLDTGEVEKLMDLPGRSVDGGDGPELFLPDLVVVEEGGELIAVEVPSGEERWRTTVRPDDPGISDRFYGGGAVAAGETLYFEFSTIREVDRPACSSTRCEVGGVMAVDRSTGEILWDTDRDQWRAQTLPQDRPSRLADTPQHVYSDGFRLTADDEQVYAYTRTTVVQGSVPGAAIERRQYELWALDAQNGIAQWARNDSTPEGTEAAGRDVPVGQGTGTFCCGYPAVTRTAVNLRLDAFEALNKGDGSEIWTSPAGRTDQIEIQGSLAMGARDDVLLAASPQSLYRLQADTGGLDWQKTELSGDQVYGTRPMTIDSGTVYVETIGNIDCGFGAPGLEARDLATGELLWTWTHEPSVGREGCSVTTTNEPAFGPGVVVDGAKDGTVTVVGQTEASLGEPDVPGQAYPGVGNETTIDASGAEAGAFGPATRYMVDWGDGSIGRWQESPTFTHTYNESGEYQAQVYAGNDANQTSSTFVAMNVGQEAPTEPNWIEERFEKDNQDMTFGILGLAVALGGGAIGVARRKRKQTMLQKELETLEEGFERTKDNPGECEAFLDTRKARAQSLLLDGNLTEEQFGVIERRIDELHGELRTSVLDTRFEFLPHGMVQSLKKMLADGRISTWEREALADLLDREETLTQAQKDKVRSQLDRWFAEDAGGGER